MQKCRLCLKHSKNFKCIFHKMRSEGITYAAVINSITNAKVSKCDGMTNQICLTCRRKTKEFWDFKLQVERSHMALQEKCPMKRVYFSNLYDSELSKEISEEKVYVPVDIANNLLINNNEPFNYNDTVIKKVPCDEKKPLSVIAFLNSIKQENEYDYQDDYSYKLNIEYDEDENSPDYKPHPYFRSRTRNNKHIQYNSNDEDDPDYKMEQPLVASLARKKHIEHDLGNDQDDPDYEIQPHYSKMLSRKNKDIVCQSDNSPRKPQQRLSGKDKENEIVLRNPIKPVYLEDYTLVKYCQERKRCKKNIADKTLICPYCGTMTKNLEIHLLSHSDEKSFQCEKCSSAFVLSSRLKLHMMSVHGPKVLKCNHCVATFSTQSRLKEHMKYHSKLKTHVCDVCNKAFKLKSHIIRHMRGTHNLGLKPVKCELCPDTFNTPYSLKHHMRVHTGERPYRCEICSQLYSYKHDFNRHCLKKHGVWFKRRTVNVLSEEVLAQEKVLMRDLMLRVNGILKDDKPVNPFEGPQAALAFNLMIEAIKSGKVVVDLQL